MAQAPLPPTSELWDTLRITAPEAVKYAKQNPDLDPEDTIQKGLRRRRRSKFKDKLAPLHCLALMGRSDIITSMLRQYRDIQINVTSFSKKWTPLMFAIQGGHLDVMQQLLDNGAIVNHQAKDGSTALHLAVTLGCLVTVEKLLVYSAMVNLQNARGDTSLHLCMGHVGTGTVKFGQRERLEMAAMLVQYGGSACLMNNMGDTPIHLCLHYAHDIKLSQILMTSPKAEMCMTLANDAGHIPLQLTTDLTTAEMLLFHGSPIDYQGSDGRTVLHMCIAHPALVTLFIDHKADVNICDKQGRTPLHLAVMDTNAPWQSICHLLMSMDEVNIKDNHGNTPLHLTCQRRQSPSRSSPIIDLLLNKGAELDVQNNRGETPLYVSLRCGHHTYAKQLLEAGASLDIKDHKGQSSRVICPRWLARSIENDNQEGSSSDSDGQGSNEANQVLKSMSDPKSSRNNLGLICDDEIISSKNCISMKGYKVSHRDSGIEESEIEETEIDFNKKSAKPSSSIRMMRPNSRFSYHGIRQTTPSVVENEDTKSIVRKTLLSPTEQMRDFHNHFKTLCQEVSSFKELLEEAMESTSNHDNQHETSLTRKKSFSLRNVKGKKNVESKQVATSSKENSRYMPESICETAYQMPGEMQLLQDELNTLAAVLQDVYQDDEGNFD